MSSTRIPVICARFQEALSASLDGETPAGERSLLAEHLAGCPTCREAESAFREIAEAARRLPRPKPAESLRRRVMAEASLSAWEIRSQAVYRERDGDRQAEWRVTSCSRVGKATPPGETGGPPSERKAGRRWFEASRASSRRIFMSRG